MMHRDPPTWAVLIADVVRSTARSDLRRLLNSNLRRATRAHRSWLKLPYAVTAGDEFQAIALRPAIIPELIFDLRRRMQPLSLRIGVGIGGIQGRLLPPVNRLSGEAFQLARRAIGDVKLRSSRKYPVLTTFRSGNEPFNRVANLVYGLHDTLVQETTARQWKTIDAFLTHQRRAPLAARALGVGPSTISRTLRRGHFWQIDETIAGMSKVMEEIFPVARFRAIS